MYAKLLRAVEVAAREGGGNVEANMTLASAVEKAKELLGSERQHRARDQALRPASSVTVQRYEEIVYEGYAPGGYRAADRGADRQPQPYRPKRCGTRSPRNGGSLGETGSGGVAGSTSQGRGRRREGGGARRGATCWSSRWTAGAEDLTDSESSWDIVSAPQDFKTVQTALEKAGVPIYSAEISMLPQSTIPVEGSEATAVLRLIDALEDLDDVQNVYANFDIPEEVMASLS